MPEHLADYLTHGKLILLLDALNEIPERDFRKRLEELAGFLDRYAPTYCIIACRVADFRRLSSDDETRKDSEALLRLRSWQTLVIEPLSDKQIRDFSIAYLGQEAGSVLLGSLLPSDPQGRGWWERSHLLPSIRELARNPFFLAVIISVYKTNQGLPRQLATLLDQFIDTAIAREMGDNWLTSQGDRLFRTGLERLAYSLVSSDVHGTAFPTLHAMEVIRRYYAEPQAIIDLALATNILVRDNQGQLMRFSHQIVMEFFASREYGRLVAAQEHVHIGSTWDEVAMLYSSALQDASSFLVALAASNASLAARCYAIGGAQIDDAARWNLIKAFVYDNVGNRRVSLFRDYFGDAAIPVLIDLMKTSQDFAYEIAISAMAEMGTSAIKPLVELIEQGYKSALDPRRTREAATLALTKLHADEVVIRLVDDADAEGLRYAAWALGWIGGAKSTACLAKLAQGSNSEVRVEATRALSNARALDALLGLAGHPDERVRYEVVVHLGTLRGDDYLSILVNKLLFDPAPYVRGAAARAIRMTESKSWTAIDAFTQALRDPDREVSFEAQRGLYYINTAESLTILSQFRSRDTST